MSLIEKLLEKQAKKSEQDSALEAQKNAEQISSEKPDSVADGLASTSSGFAPEALFDEASSTADSVLQVESDTLPSLSDEALARFTEPSAPETESSATGTGPSTANAELTESNDPIDWDQPVDLFKASTSEDENELDTIEPTDPSSAFPLFSTPNRDDDSSSGDDILALFQTSPSIETPKSLTNAGNTPKPIDSSTPHINDEFENKFDLHAESNHDDRQPTDFSDAALDALIAGDSSTKLATSSDPVASTTTTTPAKTLFKNVHIDLERLDEGGIITPNGTNNKISEEYRLIKRPLLLNILGEGAAQMQRPNLIMVTSSIPGEGKTFSSVNLAMSLAMELDRTVLLVDADVAKPSFSRVFDIEVEMGLIDILLGDATLEDTLLKTNIPKLTILPAGRRHQNSVELLGSEHMRSLTHELATRYEDRIIVFDSPPLLATTEAGVLAGLMSQIVLVVEANKTPHFVVREALSQLDPSKYISLLLNKTQKNSGSGYYYYYDYNYKDSYYYGYE